MAAATVWARKADTTLTIDGTPQKCTTSMVSRTAGEFEVTNLTSPRDSNGNLQAEFGNDVVTTKLSGTVVVDSEAASPMDIGTKLAASYAIEGEQTTSGWVRLSELSKEGGPKGGLEIKFSGSFTGEVDNT